MVLKSYVLTASLSFLGLCLCINSSDNVTSISQFENHTNWVYLPSQECGVAKVSYRIFGGNKTQLGQYPWMARLQYMNYGILLSFDCGGTLISRYYVLTAAHCQSRGNHTLVKVRLGENYAPTTIDCENDVCAPIPQDIHVKKLIVHPNFNMKLVQNDIALVLLDRAATFNDYVKPICLPNSVAAFKPVNSAEIAGWGVTEETFFDKEGMKTSDYLLYINVPVVDLSRCKEHFKKPVDERQLCAGEGKGVDSCVGDSGGPLMRPLAPDDRGPRYFQLGIVSYGKKQCGVAPAIYTKVSHFMDWILDNIKST